MLRELGSSAKFAGCRYFAGRIDDIKRQCGPDDNAGIAGYAAREHRNAPRRNSNPAEHNSGAGFYYAHHNTEHDTKHNAKPNDTQQHNSEHDNSKYDTVDYARQHDSWKQHAVNHKSDWNNHAGSVADERALCTSSRVDLQHRNNFQLDYPGQHPRQHDWQ